MKNDDGKKIVLKLVAAAVVLVAVNAVIFVFSKNGSLAPIGHISLWGAFVVLNIISITWASAMLGLRAMVVAVSYVTGGGIAYYAVQGASGVAMPEAISAGALYGAFGALTVGNFTTKLRLAFFSKPQIPFVLIVIGLLVLDGMLNSQIFHADFGTISKALIAPFVLAGGVIGVAEMMVLSSKHETGRIHDELPEVVDYSQNKKLDMISDSGATFRKLNIRAPEKPAATKRGKPAAKPAAPKPKPAPAKPAPAKPAPAAAKKPAATSAKSDDAFGDIPISFGSSAPAPAKAKEDKGGHRQVTPEELLGKKAAPVVAPEKPAESGDEKSKSDGGHLDLLNNIR